jgi:hypothetical protein
MPASLDTYVFFSLGVLSVLAYAWQRFNEPSFPNRETLPGTLAPLQYLFFSPAYQRARLTYVVASLLLYGLLVAAGPAILPTLGAVGFEDFPPSAWALIIALFLTGVGAASGSLKWLNKIEELIRRGVHALFLVPDGIERTIGLLEDAHYEPPQSQLNLVQSPLREKLQHDLKLTTGTLRYRWARATMLIESLTQIGADGHPLKKAPFHPFKDDFKTILMTYRALKARGGNLTSAGNLSSVDDLLRRIYAYISWGVRRQDNSERAVEETLQALGFDVPRAGGRRLFDIVSPAFVVVALITMAFWLIVYAVDPAMELSESIVWALTNAVTASIMYGCAVYIALSGRAAQIERKIWRERSPKCLIRIAIRAGLVTWGVIVVMTLIGSFADWWQSLVGIAETKSLASGEAANGPKEWSFLPIKIMTALPWLLAGATAGALVANSISGDVRRTDRRQRVRDAMVLGVGLGLAVAVAQAIQTSLGDLVTRNLSNVAAPPLTWKDFRLVPIIGLAGAACGAVIGFMVPYACRANLVTPRDLIMGRALRDLLSQGENLLHIRAAAEDWLFTPNNELGGITPAEAIQYKTRATGVKELLEEAAIHRREAEAPSIVPPPHAALAEQESPVH